MKFVFTICITNLHYTEHDNFVPQKHLHVLFVYCVSQDLYHECALIFLNLKKKYLMFSVFHGEVHMTIF